MTLNLHARLLQAVAAGTFAAVAPLAAQAAVTISAGATLNIACASGVCTPTKKGAVLNVTQLDGMLASGNVKITTGGSKSSDIVVSAAIGWASASTLTLDAYQSITIDKSISVNGSGGLAILTNDGGTGGDYSFGKKGNVTFLGTTNPLTINGNSYTLVDNIATLAADIAAQPAGFYALASSYDASGDGTYAASPIPTRFTGTFEGLGNTVSKLTITDTSNLGNESGQDVGMFEELGGTIRDFGLIRAKVAATDVDARVGALVGTADNPSTIIRCFATGAVTGSGEGGAAGGLVGVGNSTIEDSYTAITVHGGRGGYYGGLIGWNDGAIVQSYATGQMYGLNGSLIGGFVGRNDGSITQSYASSAVSDGTRGPGLGGLVGENEGTITQSYSIGALSADGRYPVVGGLIGVDRANAGSVTTAYWDTDTSGVTDTSKGAGNVSNDPGIVGLSTAQFQSGLPGGLIYPYGEKARQSTMDCHIFFLCFRPHKDAILRFVNDSDGRCVKGT